jgi:hypothetical protein
LAEIFMNLVLNQKRVESFARALMIIFGLATFVLFGAVFIAIQSPRGDGIPGGQQRPAGMPALVVVFLPDDSDSMVKKESSGSGKAMLLSIPAVIGGSNLDGTRPDSRMIECRTVQNPGTPRFGDLSTTASISPRKAMEFTLLGEKPSGTS